LTVEYDGAGYCGWQRAHSVHGVKSSGPVEVNGSEADSIEDAAKFRVLESDFYGTGKMPFNGAIALAHHWRLEQVADATYVGRGGD